MSDTTTAKGASPKPAARASVSSSARRQAAVLALGLIAWAVWPRPTFAAFVGSYAVALLLVSVAQAWRLQWLPEKLTRLQGALLFGLPLIVPGAVFWREKERLRDSEGLRGIDRVVEDRLRLERTPSLFPAVVTSDQPQRFYVNAPGAASVQARFAAGASPIEATSLGHGVFRVEYDPARQGPPDGSGDGVAWLRADGHEVQRKINVAPAMPHPRWLASDPVGGRAAAVSEETDELVIVDRDAKLRRLPVGDGPSDCVFYAGGTRLAVTHQSSPELWLIDAQSGKPLTKLPLGPFQRRLVVSPDGATLAVAIGGAKPGVRFVSVAASAPAELVRLAFVPEWLAFGVDAATLIVASRASRALHRLLHATPEQPEPRGTEALVSEPAGSKWRLDTRPLMLGRPASALARTVDGSVVVATTGFDASGRQVEGNHHIQHHLLTVDTALFRVAGVRITDRRGTEQDLPLNVEHGVGPSGIAGLADGSLLVAFSGSDEVWRIPPSDHNPRRFALEGLHAPHGVADLGAGRFAVSSPAGAAIAVLSYDGKVIGVARLAPDDDALGEADAAAWRRRLGEYAFYEAARAGISCQSCHLHGDSDGCAHNIGQSAKLPTLSTRGVGGTSPYLRDASYQRIRDLHDVAEELYRGFRKKVALDRGLAIEAWLKSLPPVPNPRAFEPRDLEREKRGLDAFFQAGCALCHAPPAFTNLGQHPARTLFPEYGAKLRADHFLDVPSLIGLPSSAPYLHDGRAHSIEDVLVAENRANRHGNVAALSDEQRGALVYFLESL